MSLTARIGKIIIALLSAIFLFFFTCDRAYGQERVILQKFSSDNGGDWVQIYNPTNHDINLNSYKIRDATTSNIRENFTCSLTAGGYYAVDFGTLLNNPGDTIKLYDNDELVDCVCYGAGEKCPDKDICELGNINEGEYGIKNVGSLSWSITNDSSKSDNTNCSVVENSPTPIPADEDFDHPLYITEIMPNPEGSDEAGMPGGEWIEIYNPDKFDLVGLQLKDESGHSLTIEHSNKETYQDGLYWVIYRNGDNSFSLNNDGDTITIYYQEQTLDSFSYDDCVDNKSWAKVGGSWCLSEPHKGEENHQCWSEEETDNLPSVPTLVSSPTGEPTVLPVITGKVLGALNSLTASEASSTPIGFYDLLANNNDSSIAGLTMLKENNLQRRLPFLLFGSGALLLSGAIGVYLIKQRRQS